MAYQPGEVETDDQAEVIATFPRKGGRFGPDAELRVSLGWYKGHQYIGLRVFEEGRDGRWWPVKGKGLSIKMHEAQGVADALRQCGGDLADVPPDRLPARPRRGPRPPDDRDERGLFPWRKDARPAPWETDEGGPPARASVRAPLQPHTSRTQPPWRPEASGDGSDFDEFVDTKTR